MSATLSAGVNSLVLKLDTPYDTIRTYDIRDDLVKVKVWCSTTSGFTPSDANKVFDALSLSIVISKLADGTTLAPSTPYYVKYAFISDIDETVYTISNELTAAPTAAANKYATAYLYQWSSATPGNPSGNSTYNWTTGANSTYTGTNGWSATAPSNPGTPLIKLWVASKQVTDVSSATTTSVSWASDFSIVDTTQNGANAINALLTNEAVVVAADSAGNVSSFSSAGGTFKIYDGTTDKTGNIGVTYSVASSSGVTISIASTGVYTVTAMSADSGTATLNAVYGGVTINKGYSIAKSKVGATGAAARTVDLSMTAQAFSYNSSGTTPSPSSSVVTATAQNTTGTVYYEFIVGTTSVQNTTTNTYTYTPAAAFSSMPQQISVKIRENSNTSTVLASDVMSMIGIKPGTDGTNGTSPPSVDINNIGSFYKNSGGAFTPTSLTLSAALQNVSSPNYTWTITGATPTSATGSSSVTITPDSNSTGITVSVSVTGSNLTGSVSVSRYISVVEQGTAGQAGANGVMSAYPTIYQWATSTPSRPTTTSTYTWSSGAYTAPSGWSTITPTNTTPGYILYEITVPLTVVATTTSSTLDWTNTNYSIRATTINGVNGATGATGAQGPQGSQGPAGSNGSDGSNGTNGTNGAATFLITRSANSSSAPTAAEVYAALGNLRYAVIGDIATINYNSGNNSVAYRATSSGSGASWALQSTYITGSLIVQNSVSGDRIIANTLSANKITNGTTTAFSSTSGTFSLGDQTFLIFPTTASFTANGAEKWALTGYNYGTTGYAHGIGAGSSSPNGYGVLGYSAYNINSINIKTLGAVGEASTGTYGKSLKPSTYGSTNNLDKLNTEFYGGNTSYAGIFNAIYTGASTTTKFQTLISPSPEVVPTQDWAAVFARFNTSGSPVKSVYMCSASYAIEIPSTQGKIYAYDGFGPFTGQHTGVLEDTSTVQVGDILVDTVLLTKDTVSATLLKQSLSSVPKQKTVIGVYIGLDVQSDLSTEHTITPPSSMEGDNPPAFKVAASTRSETYNLQNTEEFILINSIGEGQVNVCGENGNIEAGDLITTSSIPGKGMKQDDDIIRSYTVAKARESVTFSSPTEVKMISCTYHCG